MPIQFTKMSGAGNDFVVIDNRSGVVKHRAAAARLLCDRRWGIGADGLLLLERSRRAHYKMMYFNADGSYGGMCGNGGRCIALFAHTKKLAPRRHTFEALGHIYTAHVRKQAVTLRMKEPRDLRLGFAIPYDRRTLSVNSVDTGAPHLVIPIEALHSGARSLKDLDVENLGRRLRYHRTFLPNGTNVNFVQVMGSKSLKMRTYERGVEGETLACGTGAIASAIVASRLWHLTPPVSVVPGSGVPLMVDFEQKNDRITGVRLTGPAVRVYQGTIELGQLQRRQSGKRG